MTFCVASQRKQLLAVLYVVDVLVVAGTCPSPWASSTVPPAKFLFALAVFTVLLEKLNILGKKKKTNNTRTLQKSQLTLRFP